MWKSTIIGNRKGSEPVALIDNSASEWREEWLRERYDHATSFRGGSLHPIMRGSDGRIGLKIDTTTTAYGANSDECLQTMADHLQQLADKFRERAGLPPRELAKPAPPARVQVDGDGTYRVIILEEPDDTGAGLTAPEPAGDAASC